MSAPTRAEAEALEHALAEGDRAWCERQERRERQKAPVVVWPIPLPPPAPSPEELERQYWRWAGWACADGVPPGFSAKERPR